MGVSHIAFAIIVLAGLSSADWGVRNPSEDGLMPTTDDIAAQPEQLSSSGLPRRSSHSKVLENRDLCRIVASFLPNKEFG